MTTAELIFGLGFVLPALGLMAMIGMPDDWKTVSGWMMVSYIGIPGFLVALTLLINSPALLFGAVFFIGVAVASKK